MRDATPRSSGISTYRPRIPRTPARDLSNAAKSGRPPSSLCLRGHGLEANLRGEPGRPSPLRVWGRPSVGTPATGATRGDSALVDLLIPLCSALAGGLVAAVIALAIVLPMARGLLAGSR